MLPLLCAVVLFQQTAGMDDIVPAGTHPRLLADGFQFTEGPVWSPKDGLIFSDILGNAVYRWVIDKAQVYRKPSHRAIGNTLDGSGQMISCEQETRSVVRYSADGKETVLADRFEGNRLNAPDDVAARSDGNIYFTDPSFALRASDKEQSVDGVYRIDPKGAISLVSKSFAKPNGVCFSPDEKTLYVNDTVRQQIYAFDVSPDGAVSRERLFSFVTGELAGQPNGMKVDRQGNVYCTGPGGIQIFSAAGKYRGLIYMPQVVSNFCFGGKDYKTLYITAGSGLYSIQLKKAGMPPAVNISALR